jgi:hypothetical protein
MWCCNKIWCSKGQFLVVAPWCAKMMWSIHAIANIKGHVMDDLVTEHCGLEVAVIEPIPWTMFFDG